MVKKAGKQSNDSDGADPTRRRLIFGLSLGLIATAVLELGWVFASFLRPGRGRQRGPVAAAKVVIAGSVERFAPGSVTAFQRGKFYLVRLREGGFLALHRKCTHLGCTAAWDEERERFICPCHASAFDIKGDVISPPAPRPLDRFAVRIENGIVKVETDRPLRRSAFDPTQIASVGRQARDG